MGRLKTTAHLLEDFAHLKKGDPITLDSMLISDMVRRGVASIEPGTKPVKVVPQQPKVSPKKPKK